MKKLHFCHECVLACNEGTMWPPPVDRQSFNVHGQRCLGENDEAKYRIKSKDSLDVHSVVWQSGKRGQSLGAVAASAF